MEVGSSFLKRGMTFSNLRLSGKMPVVSDWFTVVVTAFNKSNLTDFIKKVDISSTPVLTVFMIFFFF